MRKVLISLAAGAVAFLGFAPAATATRDDGPHKAVICHWANGNPHLISVALPAVDEGGFETAHGDITESDADGNVAGFVLIAHPTPGHDKDYLVAFDTKVKDLDDETVEACEGQDVPDNPGPPGEDGEDGEDGHSPELTILCFPGVGLGILVDYDGESQLPDGSHILGNGSICPLAGADGADGADGESVVGPKGDKGDPGSSIVGPQGPAGVTVPVTTTTTPEAAPQPAPLAELPRTGAGGVLMWIALIAIASGLLFWGVGKLVGSSDESEEVI